FWERFSELNKEKIEALAKELNETLFLPQYDTPINTIELPIAGKGYSTQSLELIYNLVNLSNDIDIEDNHIKNKLPLILKYRMITMGRKLLSFWKKQKKH